MQAFAEKMYELCSQAQPVVIALSCVSLLIIGLMMIYPSQKSKEAAKDAIPFVILGIAICLGAVTLGKWLGSLFAF